MSLSFDGIGVTDAGLGRLAKLVSLTELDVSGSKATAAGAKKLAAALPHCAIVYPGGAMGPKR